MFHRKFCFLGTVTLSVLSIALTIESAQAQRRIQIGGPFGIGVGGGRGLTIGGGYGVQLGGGQGLRFGPPNAGVQYGGGQLLRYGTPNAGVRIGGGEGVRLGTPQSGIQFGNGNGMQVGRYPYPNRPAPIVQPIIPIQQPPTVYGQPVYPAQLNPPLQGFQQAPIQPNIVVRPQAIPAQTISNLPTTTPAPIFAPASPVRRVVPQTQFDAARQPASTPAETLKPTTAPVNEAPSLDGVSILKRD